MVRSSLLGIVMFPFLLPFPETLVQWSLHFQLLAVLKLGERKLLCFRHLPKLRLVPSRLVSCQKNRMRLPCADLRPSVQQDPEIWKPTVVVAHFRTLIEQMI